MYSRLIELPPDHGFYKYLLEPKNKMVELLFRDLDFGTSGKQHFSLDSSDKLFFRKADKKSRREEAYVRVFGYKPLNEEFQERN